MLFTLEDDEGEEKVRDLPTVFVVCSTCKGAGAHVNPSIDGNGITASEWRDDWDPEERETYMSGGYDVQCFECHGQRVVAVVDEEHLPPKDLEFYIKYLKVQSDYARWDAEDRHTRRMESGGY